jgi:hypothetical protein
MREILPIIWLLEEEKHVGLKVHCKVFEDNASAIPKMRPRTKHLNIKYHQGRNNKEIN